VRWQKNGSFGFLSVGSCVGKNQMCHFVLWAFLSFVCSLIFALSLSFRVAANVFGLGEGGDFQHKC
jgi:hypothetical protein